MSYYATKAGIKNEIEEKESEIDDLRGEINELQEALKRDEDEDGFVVVGEACKSCGGAMNGPLLCNPCRDNAIELMKQGMTPSQISVGNSDLAIVISAVCR